jgi:hypothetical protein
MGENKAEGDEDGKKCSNRDQIQTDKGKGEMMRKYRGKEDRGRRQRKRYLCTDRKTVGRKRVGL